MMDDSSMDFAIADLFEQMDTSNGSEKQGEQTPSAPPGPPVPSAPPLSPKVMYDTTNTDNGEQATSSQGTSDKLLDEKLDPCAHGQVQEKVEHYEQIGRDWLQTFRDPHQTSRNRGVPMFCSLDAVQLQRWMRGENDFQFDSTQCANAECQTVVNSLESGYIHKANGQLLDPYQPTDSDSQAGVLGEVDDRLLNSQEHGAQTASGDCDDLDSIQLDSSSVLQDQQDNIVDQLYDDVGCGGWEVIDVQGQRVFDMQKPRWQPDSGATGCNRCKVAWSFLVRRHHCRFCGQLFCDPCSSQRLMLPPNFQVTVPQRVCSDCAELLAPFQVEIAAQCSESQVYPVNDLYNSQDPRSWAQVPMQSMRDELYQATTILRNIAQCTSPDAAVVLPALLSAAAGLAIVRIVRGGFGYGFMMGSGVVVARNRQDDRWSEPCSIGCVGASAGYLMGMEVADVLLLFRSRASVRAYVKSSGAGMRISSSAVMGLGRQLCAGVELNRDMEMSYVLYYGMCKGAFIGMSIDAMMTWPRECVNRQFYGRPRASEEILFSEQGDNGGHGQSQKCPAAQDLYNAISMIVEGRGDRYKLIRS